VPTRVTFVSAERLVVLLRLIYNGTLNADSEVCQWWSVHE
jgi:hypothetical protein